MSLEQHHFANENDGGGGLVESNSVKHSSSESNLITDHIPIDGQMFFHQSINNKINSRTNQFPIYNGKTFNNNNNNMTAFTSNSSPTTVRSSKLLLLQQHTNGVHNIHETFIAENNMNGTATIVGSASTNNIGNTQHIGDNLVLVTTDHHHHQHHHQQQQHHLQITNSDHDIINNNNNNNISMVNANGNTTTTMQGGNVVTNVETVGTTLTGTVTTDEELTPLHWLHDKNLLKGINLSCNKAQSRPDSPNRHKNGGRLTPTSDFVEDSSISDENNSSVNSNYDQNVTENSPKPNHNSHTYYNNAPQNLSIINRSINNVSPSSLSSTKSPSLASVEMNSNYIQRQQQQYRSSPTPSTSSSNSTSTLSSLSPTNLSITVNSSSNINGSSNNNNNNNHSNNVSPHTHFHKKYLREQQMHEMQPQSNAINHVTAEEIVRQQLQQQFVAPILNYSALKSEMTPQHFRNEMKSELDCDEYMNEHSISSYSGSPVPENELNNKYQQEISPQKSSIQSNNNKDNNNKHPNNLPYDPQLHTNNKPPYSFSCLIFMAIEDSSNKALPVKEIYSWITQHFPYFKTAPNGWKNSVRHNLSLNKSFQKVEKAANLGKGSLWMVDEQYRPNLIQALTRSPFHPIPSIEKTVMKAANSMPNSTNRNTPNKNNSNSNSVMQQGVLKDGSRLPNPEHFPFLSRRLAAMDNEPEQLSYTNGMSFNVTPTIMDGNEEKKNEIENDDSKIWCADSIDDVNAAAAMLALKHGPKIFTEVFQDGHPPIITTSPSEDHTYSSAISAANGARTASGSSSDANSNGTSSDAAYESGEESHNNQSFYEMEEQRRLAEGADALLNLAGISTPNYNCDRPRTTAVKRLGSPEFDSNMPTTHPYYSAANQTNITHNYSSPPKKHKSRMLKSKLKKKAAWLR
uniref:CSON004604 protein n=1 Tax=Culicoides sonorensis TaxID=179676 RepID=A0A336L7S2_CULSO